MESNSIRPDRATPHPPRPAAVPPPSQGEALFEKPPIGPAEIRAAAETLRRYRAGKARLERRLVDNERFWKLRHWDETADGEPRPVSAWLVNVILNRHADAVDNYPEPNCLPRAADDAAEAARLTRILPVILKQNGFAQVYSDCWWYKLKSGTACYGVFWDAGRWNGLGDVSIRKVDLLNLYWEPGISDLQRSRNIFHVEMRSDAELEETWPQLRGKLGRGAGDAPVRFPTEDAPADEDRTPVVDWYYRRRGKLHYCKFCAGEVLYSSENQDPDRPWYDHGKYPFVLDVLFPEEGSPCGYGYVDICKNPQKQIDLMNRAMLKNTLAAATPRFFLRDDGAVNEEEFADWSRPFVHTGGALGQDSILPITSTPLPGSYLSFLQMKIQELRDTAGNTETATGAVPSGVTAASAIAALQEASGKLSRDMVEATYRSFEEICLLVIDLIRQFYTMPRQFRITGEMGEETFTSYDNSGLRPRPLDGGGLDLGYRSPVIDIEVVPQNESRYTKAEYNELALKLFAAGLFQPRLADQALACLEMMDFKGREALMRRVARGQTLENRLAAAEALLSELAAEREADGASAPTGGRSLRGEGAGGAEPTDQGASDAPTPPVKAKSLTEKHTGESPVTARARARTRASARVR